MRTIQKLITAVSLSAVAGLGHAQHSWQSPPVRAQSDVEAVLGKRGNAALSRPRHIVWVWGVDKNHERGAHEYGWVMDRYVNVLLPAVPGVSAEQAMYFPTDEQWRRADLVVFYLQSRAAWGESEWRHFDEHRAGGGGLIFLHLALLQGDGVELAKRIGLAYGLPDSPGGASRWGVLPTPVRIRNAHPIFRGFDADLDLVDELYWNLTGEGKGIDIWSTAQAGPEMGSSGPPEPGQLDGRDWPLMWTRVDDRARVFATVAGHNYFTFNDPMFRIILLRAIAWTMHEPLAPFEALVTQHLGR